MARRIKLVVAYDGTAYSGWQLQGNAVTIEQRLNEAIRQVTGEEIQVIGASRTDAGVHALGNIAVFDTDSRIPGDKFVYALNRCLPPDIVVQWSGEVSTDYHPRHCDTRKTYCYKILNRKFPLPMYRRDSYFYHYPLDVGAMRAAAAYLVGEHDFKSFCSVYTQAKTTVRTIYDIQVVEKPVGACLDDDYMASGRELDILVTGNGFLYNMVRIITGTLLEVGAGRRTPESVGEALAACSRQCAGPTAPPQGLTLVEIIQDV